MALVRRLPRASNWNGCANSVIRAGATPMSVEASEPPKSAFGGLLVTLFVAACVVASAIAVLHTLLPTRFPWPH